MSFLDLGDATFLSNLLNSKSTKKSTTDYIVKNPAFDRILTTKLSGLLEREPTLAIYILDKLGWIIDHAACQQILQIVKDVNQENQSISLTQQIINNNGAIVAHTHEKFIQAFQDDPNISNLYPFTKRRNVEIIAYSIDQYCDLSSYEDYEIGYKTITTVAWSDYRMRNQRDMLINEGYDVDITSVTVEDMDTHIQYYHTWLYNRTRNGNTIIRKITLEQLLKQDDDYKNSK